MGNKSSNPGRDTAAAVAKAVRDSQRIRDQAEAKYGSTVNKPDLGPTPDQKTDQKGPSS